MKSVKELIKARRSVRTYDGQVLDENTREQLGIGLLVFCFLTLSTNIKNKKDNK